MRYKWLTVITLLFGSTFAQPAYSGDTESMLGEISCTAANYCPRGWLECNGQILNTSSFSALFSLLGNKYGGDGRTTFALPNLQGRTIIGAGSGSGLTARTLASTGGADSVTLAAENLPQHAHAVQAHAGTEQSASPTGKISGTAPSGSAIYTASAPNTTMGSSAISNSGAGQSHDNRQPYLTLKCCISIMGLYPPRQ